jgi:hypothetical protein
LLDEIDHHGLKVLNLINAMRAPQPGHGGEPRGSTPVLPFPGR